MITSVLVANRGEIARRIFRTCRSLGIATVAVYSDADADAPHVHEADAAVRLPGSTPAQTYLRADLIIAAAQRTGADAIHPGYGFLSENAAFARDVIAAGLSWIGPPPESIDSMGSKIESKALMAAAGVPVLTQLTPENVVAEDLPVLIKASSGGGGRGMRVVRDLADLNAELELASAEAASAFGDPTVFCETYLPTGHHVEVQVMADQHGTVWAVGERECSIQRRHQKIVEEAPSPLVERTDGMREALFEASRAATKTIGYTGAGTVEFLAADDGQFYFLEMNTRLQVEHPVTECTTGLDLVALQLEVADGGRLAPEPPATVGHAIEVRLYAEDPAPAAALAAPPPAAGPAVAALPAAALAVVAAPAAWQPQSGTLHRFQVPGVSTNFDLTGATSGLRLDSGVRDGSVVGIHYDPMLAKLISWAPSRRQAARALAGALQHSTIHGLKTNRDLLVNVLRHPAFLAGETDTAFFERHGLQVLAAPLADAATEILSALAATLAIDVTARDQAPVLGAIASGWRNVVSQPQWLDLAGPHGPHHVTYRYTRAGGAPGNKAGGAPSDEGVAAEGGLAAADYPDVALLRAKPDEVILAVAGVRRRFAIARYGSETVVDSSLGSVSFTVAERFTDPSHAVVPGSLLATMPGSVVRVAVAAGDAVTAGQPILWLEAMKMQHQVNAPIDGTITELNVQPGAQVEVGAVLAVVAAAPDTP